MSYPTVVSLLNEWFLNHPAPKLADKHWANDKDRRRTTVIPTEPVNINQFDNFVIKQFNIAFATVAL